jgi:hypothetical protein
MFHLKRHAFAAHATGRMHHRIGFLKAASTSSRRVPAIKDFSSTHLADAIGLSS